MPVPIPRGRSRTTFLAAALGAAALALLLFPPLALAAQRLHGVVLAVTPKTGEVVVRHDPFGSMPAMTMTFRVVPPERAAQLQPGSVIDADVDTTTEPWTLRRVSSVSAQRITDDAVRHVPALRVGDVVPDTPFVDQTGRPFRLSEYRGDDVLLSFIYTRCQDARMCPLISAKFRQLQERSAGRKLHLVEVTLDPTYDRPPVLARYGRTFGADPQRWSIVVGDAQPTLDFAARFGVSAFPDPDAGIVHSENTVLIGPDGRIASMRTDTAWLPADVVAQIDAQHADAARPLARFDAWLREGATALCGESVAGFSGLADLGVLLAVFGALAYVVYRLARKLFIPSV